VPNQAAILLPNNGNVIATARQAQELAPDRRILVVPSADLAQGVAAIMAFNFERSAAENRDAMEQAMRRVQTGEVTQAVKDATLDGKRVSEGQFIGLARGKLASVASQLPQALLGLLEHLGAKDDDAITLYQGQDVTENAAQQVEQAVRQRFPEADVKTYEGGQPHYHYLAAVE
jgi:dihydroxyacetone kinase-like predicted kinase